MTYTVLAHNYDRGYTLLVRTKSNGELVKCQPFVVAWCYDTEKKDWLCGHYFDNITKAVKYFNGK